MNAFKACVTINVEASGPSLEVSQSLRTILPVNYRMGLGPLRLTCQCKHDKSGFTIIVETPLHLSYLYMSYFQVDWPAFNICDPDLCMSWTYSNVDTSHLSFMYVKSPEQQRLPLREDLLRVCAVLSMSSYARLYT